MTAVRSTRRLRRGLAVSLLAIATLASALGTAAVQAPPAAADSEGSAHSRLVGRGDIVTSVLANLGGTRQHRSSSARPRCLWTSLNDAQIEFLVAVLAPRRGSAASQLFFDALPAYFNSDGITDATLQVQICDGQVLALRTVQRTEPLDTQTLVGRQMITRLPSPDPVQSPPVGVVVPVHEPVFVSLPDTQWQPISTTLTVGSITAEVRATPLTLRVFSGEPTGVLQLCPGQGVAFDPRNVASPSRQARQQGACVLTYASATSRSGGSATNSIVPDAWLGTVTVLWAAEWRTNGGPWRSLGLIPRTRLIERSTREVSTALESGHDSGR